MQLEACVHPFFDELRDPNCRLPNGRPLPPLFNFKPQELKGATPDILQRLIPEHARKQNPTLALWGHPASLHFASLLAFSTFQWWILLLKGCWVVLLSTHSHLLLAFIKIPTDWLS
jgi:hypothetical protein